MQVAPFPSSANAETGCWPAAPQRADATSCGSGVARGGSCRRGARSARTPPLSSPPSGACVGSHWCRRHSGLPGTTLRRWPLPGCKRSPLWSGPHALAGALRTRASPAPKQPGRRLHRLSVKMACVSWRRWRRRTPLRPCERSRASRRCAGPGNATMHRQRPRLPSRGSAPVLVYGCRRTVRCHERPRGANRPMIPRRGIVPSGIRRGPGPWGT
jgi:hypothetical protein